MQPNWSDVANKEGVILGGEVNEECIAKLQEVSTDSNGKNIIPQILAQVLELMKELEQAYDAHDDAHGGADNGCKPPGRGMWACEGKCTTTQSEKVWWAGARNVSAHGCSDVHKCVS